MRPGNAQILEEIRSALGQAKVVTSGRLSLSRAGIFTGERVMLDAAIEELARILRQVLPPETHLVLKLNPDLAVRSNGAFLQAALLNLVLNARDAMPDGGRLTIETVAEARFGGGGLTGGEPESGDYALLRVADTGCGMGLEILLRVETAEDGMACLEWLRRDPGFDLVLSDVSMPHLDGVDLCGALVEAYPALPVILMTGQAPSVFPQGKIRGAPTVLRKPLDVQMLRTAIASLDLPRP